MRRRTGPGSERETSEFHDVEQHGVRSTQPSPQQFGNGQRYQTSVSTPNLEPVQRNQCIDHLTFTCDNCSREFSDQSSLFDHIEDCRPIKCKECATMLCDYERLKVHFYHCHQVLINVCRYCLHICYGRDASAHGHPQCLVPGYSCEYCPEILGSFDALQNHNQIHESDAWRACSYCAFKSHISRRLKLHCKNHFNEDTQMRCPYCAWGSNSYDRMRTHMDQYHHGNVRIASSLTNELPLVNYFTICLTLNVCLQLIGRKSTSFHYPL